MQYALLGASIVLSTGCIYGQTATVTVDTTSRNYAIPQDFSGLGFETATVTSNVDQGGVNGNFWTPDNTQLTTLFQNLSIKDLRIGGSWTDMGGSALDPHLVASSTQDERIQLFSVDSSGAVWSDWQPTSGGGWNGWASFGGAGLAFYPGQP